MTKDEILQVIDKCRRSFIFFCENFCKIQHRNAGILPFKLFPYQRASVKAFRQHDRVIYLKCRQSGISTLTGAYALWVAMFYPNRNILIVSKRDEDAMNYLGKNVRFVYEHLPEFFWEIFGDPREGFAKKYGACKTYNEHNIGFYHGSEIRSLTSSKDTLRSNQASLVIIDEAAFIPDMEQMWTAGQPTLMHGGSVIVISTTNGRGNWYSNTIDDARAKNNNFHLIEIPWYKMDWVLEWKDTLSGKRMRLSPCDGVEPCVTEEDKAQFGEFKSPWLIQQLRELHEKGEDWKFRQEILMEFIGSGNTVLCRESLNKLVADIDNNPKMPTKPVTYSNPTAGIDSMLLYFAKNLWVWELPVRSEPDVVKNGRIIVPGKTGHRYAIGGDVSTGESSDFSGLVVLDVTTMRQVAELMIKVETHMFAKMCDYLGRFYNNALLNIESTGIGKAVVQDLKSVYFYPNLFYRRLPSGKRDKIPGFPTSGASKNFIVKAMTDNIGTENVLFRSSRLSQQANTFIHLSGGRTGNEPGTNNNDDLMISAGLACLAIADAMETPDGLIPTSSQAIEAGANEKITLTMDEIMRKGGHTLMYPIVMGDEPSVDMTMEQELLKFTMQLGGLPQEVISQRRYAMPKTKPAKKYY